MKLSVTLVLFLLLIPVVHAEDVNHAVIVMYHRFGESEMPSTNISLKNFNAQLAYLESHHFSVWPLAKLVNDLQQHKPVPDRTIAITIDDAYLSVYEKAFPLLQKKKWPFTVFVSSDQVDKQFKAYMTWDQIREMHRAGVTFANHTGSHTHLVGRLHDENEQQWRLRVVNEITHAQKRLEQELGDAPMLFAYPYGEYSEALMAIVSELGYVGFGQHSGAIGAGSDFTALPRFPVSEHFADMNDFAIKVNSLPFPIESELPKESVVANAQTPGLKFKFAQPLANYGEFRCYSTGNKLMRVKWLSTVGDEVEISIAEHYPQRRYRYNCTLPVLAAKGRYYWHSHPWIQAWIPED